MGQRPTYEDENGFYSATSLSGNAVLPFVISTGAQRSGEISVWMPRLGNVLRRTCSSADPFLEALFRPPRRPVERSVVSFGFHVDSKTLIDAANARS
ncbi:MAG: hypothetical protein QOJ51_5803 [Acidobacteriaceae bacterium]|jgi:hypothetical protein|nr:hypothetical protein [Acidobacteriaceae bacterium]MEA2262978.1 hypothetical protein [Acidobacteriaceae bacterium]